MCCLELALLILLIQYDRILYFNIRSKNLKIVTVARVLGCNSENCCNSLHLGSYFPFKNVETLIATILHIVLKFRGDCLVSRVDQRRQISVGEWNK